MRWLIISTSVCVAYKLMELMDVNGDGVIDFGEFCKVKMLILY